jgi:hypothetical protein
MDFFKEYEELKLQTPRCALFNIGAENSDYCVYGRFNKNCYICRGCDYDEDLMYAYWCYHDKDCVDCSYCYDSELLYECVDCRKCYDLGYSQNCKHCNDSSFLFNCIGCKNCYGCVNLKQAEFCIFNEKCSREQYEERLAELKKLPIDQQKERFRAFLEQQPHVYMHQLNNEHCTGDYVYNSKNSHACYDVKEVEDCLYLTHTLKIKDSVDCDFMYGAERCYECVSVEGLNNHFCYVVWGSNEMEYCELCFNCRNCFGCIGLKNREYHILNKPYSPEEYHKKVAEIKGALLKVGKYNGTLPKIFFEG